MTLGSPRCLAYFGWASQFWSFFWCAWLSPVFKGSALPRPLAGGHVGIAGRVEGRAWSSGRSGPGRRRRSSPQRLWATRTAPVTTCSRLRRSASLRHPRRRSLSRTPQRPSWCARSLVPSHNSRESDYRREVGGGPQAEAYSERKVRGPQEPRRTRPEAVAPGEVASPQEAKGRQDEPTPPLRLAIHPAGPLPASAAAPRRTVACVH